MNNQTKVRQLGPIVGATLLTSNLQQVVSAYQTALNFKITSQRLVTESLANLWSSPKLLGNRICTLKSANGDNWLRIIEDKDCKTAQPLKTHGWMSLENNVGDVEQIRQNFTDDSAFKVIGEPAYLQVSDAIKAMQVIGPAGEVAYLTEVQRPVPPFELPMSDAETGSLFIPVLNTPNRDESVAFYEKLNAADSALKFDTKVTVLNNAWHLDIEHQFPVATLQLDGLCLFEIDQVTQAQPVITNDNSLPSGIAMISCRAKNIDTIAKAFNKSITHIEDDYYPANKVLILTGAAGELIELIG